jgi:hypothetical protein
METRSAPAIHYGTTLEQANRTRRTSYAQTALQETLDSHDLMH